MRFQMFATAVLILLFFSNSDLGIHFNFVNGQSEKELLLELRNNLTYDSSLSTKLVHWNESSDFCQWPGLKCDSKTRVSGLDLSGESISGGINDAHNSLFNLAYLQSLSLAQNAFASAELPSGFGQLSELTYLNLSNSGFSGQVPSDFSNLTRLVVLDLSNTIYTALQLTNPNLRSLIRNLSKLRELHLNGVNISANGYEWSSAISSSLPNLRVLSLSNSYLTGPLDSSLLKLNSLSSIHLDSNSLSSPFPDFFTEFSNLRVFTASSCDLTGVVPAKLFEIKGLQTVDLSNNRDLQGSLPEFPVNGSLQNLLLSYTQFSGNVSESIGNLRMLSNFDLRSCSFSGPVPSTIQNLDHLVYLDLSLNQFSGSVPSFASLKNLAIINLRSNRLSGPILESHWKGLDNLEFLDLSENSLQGDIPSSLFVLPKLKVLSLYNNSFSGSIKLPTVASSSSLESFDISVNSLEGSIPPVLFELHNLSSLSLSWNNFNGSLELTDFRKLKNLVSLELSYNDLIIHVDEEVSVSSLLPRLGTLKLASCKLQNLPLLKNQSSLMMLDLSDNQLGGEIPNWTWDVGNGFLRYLNLSHNRFTHLEQPYNLRSLQYLDLHSNELVGQIPFPLPSSGFIDLSSNNFTSSLPNNIGNSLKSVIYFSVAGNKIKGAISSSFCNASNLRILDLSENSFNGRIPSCLLESTTLSVLNLKRNNLDGDIPDTYPVGCRLETLDLSWNVLRGKVPKSLTRCTEMEVLNLGNNVLNDTFPCWLKSLSKLRVLVLRFNNFHGDIDCLGDSQAWPNLQIISFASNNINGVIPANMFRILQALMVTEDDQQLEHLHVLLTESNIYYQDSVTVTLKGQEIEMEKILTIFTSIDFSDNHLHGSIPQTIGEVKSLYNLNFSHNALSGHIPPTLVNLQKLESLDLSFNSIDGEIPTELASLTFLSFLNLSYNHLVGRIPRGSQFQTFPESSFIGNDGLCGFPLNKTCNDTGTSPAIQQEKLEREKDLKKEIYVSGAMGFVVGLGFIFAPIMLCKRWRKWYNKCLDRIIMLLFHQQDHQLENEDW